MQCDEVRARLADDLAGTLTAAESDALAQHVLICGPCSNEVESLGRVWALLGRVPASEPDSARLRARLDSVIQVSANESRAGAGPLSAWRVPLAAAAAVLLFASGVGTGRALAPSEPVADLVALREELQQMRVLVGLSLMQQTSASERLRGVNWSGQIDQPGQEIVAALLDTLMHDPNDNVRLATVDALRRFADRESVRRGALDALPRQQSPLVQIALIDLVVEANDPTAADTLRRMAEDDSLHEAVRARAARAVQLLG